MKAYTPETLAEENGKNGHGTLVAVGGKVYDVSASKNWVDGIHMKRHQQEPISPTISPRLPMARTCWSDSNRWAPWNKRPRNCLPGYGER